MERPWFREFASRRYTSVVTGNTRVSRWEITETRRRGWQSLRRTHSPPWIQDTRSRRTPADRSDLVYPGGIPAEQTPQIVLLTFDDAVNDLNKPLYADLFENGRKNPNGCPITATFYVSHEWTDYSQVQNLYADGHELASHTIS